MFLFQRNLAIKKKIEDFLEMVNQTLMLYQESMEHYVMHHLDDHYRTLVQKTHQSESKADDLRREIETELFNKSLLPEIREDIIQLIDRVDKIPNRCEHILRRIHTHNIILPDEMDPKVLELVKLGVECCLPLKDAAMDVLGTCARIKEIARGIDSNESVADQIEHELIYLIFHGDYEPFDKVMYRDVVVWIAGLPDLAEQICDHLTIFAIKRNV